MNERDFVYLRDELLHLDARLTGATHYARLAGCDAVAAFLETANDQIDAAHSQLTAQRKMAETA